LQDARKLGKKKHKEKKEKGALAQLSDHAAQMLIGFLFFNLKQEGDKIVPQFTNPTQCNKSVTMMR
jgi:hypothetical protein